MGKRGCSWCAQLDNIPGLREWVELLERRSVNFVSRAGAKARDTSRAGAQARDFDTNARFRPLNIAQPSQKMPSVGIGVPKVLSCGAF